MLTTMLLLLFAADLTRSGPDKEELKKLQGTWLVIEQAHGGKKAEAKELAKLVLEVSGAQMTTREKGELKEDVAVIGMNAKVQPGTLDLKVASGADVGKVVKAIFKRDGDTLTICVAEPGKDRPTTFAGAEGSGHTLLVFKKAKTGR